jgi:hypothetical protein
VSLIDEVDGSLAAMSTGVGRAVELTMEAHEAAEQIALRSAASGFAGIAQRMGQVRVAVEELGGQLTVLGQAVMQARGPVGRVPQQMTPEDIITILGPLEEQLAALHSQVGAGINRVDQIRQLVVGALQGGQPGPMLRRLDAIRQTLTLVAQHADAGRQQAEVAVAQARQVGDAGK